LGELPPLLPEPPEDIRRLIEQFLIEEKGLKGKDRVKLIKWISENIPRERRLEFLGQYTSRDSILVKKLIELTNKFDEAHARLKELIMSKKEPKEIPKEERFVEEPSPARGLYEEEIWKKVYAETPPRKEGPSTVSKIADTIYQSATELFPEIYQLALEHGYQDSPDGIKQFIRDIIDFWLRYRDEINMLEDYKALVRVLVDVSKPSFMKMVMSRLIYDFYIQCVKMKAEGYNIDAKFVGQIQKMLFSDLARVIEAG